MSLAVGVLLGVFGTLFVFGIVSCIAEWRAAMREGDALSASFERAKRGGR